MSSTAHAVGFSPGERVPETGIYKARHSGHSAAPQVIYEGGKKFQLCTTCFWSVRYMLVSQCSPEDLERYRARAKGAK